MASVRFFYVNALEGFPWFLNGPPATIAGNQWTNGSATVTRATGDYEVLGLKRWSLISGTLAAKFPASTRVADIVDPLTFTASAAATAGGSGTDTGTFTPAAPLVETPEGPMTNLWSRQRYVPWITPDPIPASPIDLYFDFGLSTSFQIAAGLRSVAQDPNVTVGINTIQVQGGATFGAWTTLGWISFPIRDRDSGAPWASAAYRFIRFRITPDAGVTPLSLGRLWIGGIGVDTGVDGFPASEFEDEGIEERMETPLGFPIVFRAGEKRRRWFIDYASLDASQFAKIKQVAALLRTQTLLMMDEDDLAFEVMSLDGKHRWSRPFAVGLYKTGLSLVSLT